jgi:hypothetical protein
MVANMVYAVDRNGILSSGTSRSCKTKGASEFVNRIKMVRDDVETEVVALSAFVDSVHRKHQTEPVLPVHMSIEATPRGVTGNGNGSGNGTLASARHHHEFYR